MKFGTYCTVKSSRCGILKLMKARVSVFSDSLQWHSDCTRLNSEVVDVNESMAVSCACRDTSASGFVATRFSNFQLVDDGRLRKDSPKRFRTAQRRTRRENLCRT